MAAAPILTALTGNETLMAAIKKLPRGAASGTVLTYKYMPTIKITKHHPGYVDLMKKYPSGKIPDPSYPEGITVQVPAWMAVFIIIVGSAGGILALSTVEAFRHMPGLSAVFGALGL